MWEGPGSWLPGYGATDGSGGAHNQSKMEEGGSGEEDRGRKEEEKREVVWENGLVVVGGW